jgi:hypothetical protein
MGGQRPSLHRATLGLIIIWHDHGKADILTYLHSSPLAVESVPDIMAYWENWQADQPALAEMALDYISAPHERDFLILTIS